MIVPLERGHSRSVTLTPCLMLDPAAFRNRSRTLAATLWVSAATFTFFGVIAHAANAAKAPPAPTPKPAENYPLKEYLTGLAEQQWQARATTLAGIKTAADVEARGRYIRTTFLEGIGGLPQTRTPLNARITGRFDRKGYRVENLIYESVPGCFVTANVYIPTTGRGPFPAIVGAAGHAMPDGKANTTYQRAFISLAQRGFIVLAYDPPAQGERFELQDPKTGAMKSLGHISPGLQCLLTGRPLARHFIWDGIRAVDYLLTRDDVDPKRLGATGNSGGGTQSAYLAVAEPRLAAAAPSCYWTSWEQLWNSNGPQDSEQIIPGFIQHGLNFSDYAVAMAPRPITMLTATRDMFPIEGARAQHAEAQKLFALLGAKEKAGFFEYDDGHGWSQPRRDAACAWFEKWLYDRPTSAPEPADLQPDAQKTLTCTETGFTVTALNSKTSQRLNQDWAEEIYPKRKLGNVTNAEKARDTIAARLAIPRARRQPTALSAGRQTRSGLVDDEVIVTSVTGAQIQVILHFPSGSGARQPAVIILRDDAAAGPAGSDPEVVAWRKAGYVVAVAQLPGVDRTPTKPNNYYSMRYRTAMRAILVGQTMAGIHTNDLLAVFDVISARPEVDSGKVSILGHGNLGAIAQFAAALEPKIARTISSGALVSYMDLVRAPECPETFCDLIVPGVLQDLDLSDLAAVAGKGKVIVVNPRSSTGQPVSEAAAGAYRQQARVVVATGPVTPALLETR